MMISIEVPVIRGGWLMQCIDSVLQQTSANWRLCLYWDRGDALSRKILEALQELDHPRIRIHIGSSSLGIARARQFLTQHSDGELVLPLDDDDVLLPTAVERFLSTASERPWAGIIRARRGFIDERGEPIAMDDWFPFQRRHYYKGATCDISNHSQPYVIRRDLLLDTGGWQGIEDFDFVGEDCTCFAKIEEVAEIELLDEVLYQYRIQQRRTSLRYDQQDADEMWRRIADAANARRRSQVRRINHRPPFTYIGVQARRPRLSDMEVVIPFWETNEREIPYACSRPSGAVRSFQIPLRADGHFSQHFDPILSGFNRLEVAISSHGRVDGWLCVAFFHHRSSFSPAVIFRGSVRSDDPFEFDYFSIEAPQSWNLEGDFARMEMAYEPALGNGHEPIFLHTLPRRGSDNAIFRVFGEFPGFCRSRLDNCFSSVLAAGIDRDAIHIIEKRQSSAANRNEGFRNCARPWVCFMDDDVQLDNPSTLQEILDCTVASDAALAGPKLLTASGRIYSGVPYTNPITMEAHVAGLGGRDLGQYDVNTLVPWLPSTVLLTHQSAMLSTGGFDEQYAGSQYEDVDFCLRARARGFTCCYVGKAAAIHHNHIRNGRFTRNSQYLKNRWHGRRDLFTWSTEDAATAG